MIIMATQLTQQLETIEELFNSKYVNDIDFRMNLILHRRFFLCNRIVFTLTKTFCIEKGIYTRVERYCDQG